MSNIDLLNNAPLTKANSAALGVALAEKIMSGELNPVLAMIKIKALEEAFDYVKKHKDVKNYVLTHAEREGRSFELHGAKITIAPTYTKYDYSGCNDSKLDDIAGKIKVLESERKAREDMLKTLPASGMADPETGEVLKPPMKIQTEGIKITLG